MNLASKNEKANEVTEKEITEEKECFVIMPISDPDGYKKGHFKMIYEDIFKKAIIDAGFRPYRADDSKSSNMIQIDIVKRIIEAPMAICDLSTKNPNVLFELGIRQAFDKPVLLVQEEGNARIFDINTINTYEYKKECIYSEVLKDQRDICSMLKETYNDHSKGDCINSLIRLIKMEPAKYNSIDKVDSDEMFKVIFNEIMGIKNEINRGKIGKDYFELYDETLIEGNKIITISEKFKSEKEVIEQYEYLERLDMLYMRIQKFFSMYKELPHQLITKELRYIHEIIKRNFLSIDLEYREIKKQIKKDERESALARDF